MASAEDDGRVVDLAAKRELFKFGSGGITSKNRALRTFIVQAASRIHYLTVMDDYRRNQGPRGHLLRPDDRGWPIGLFFPVSLFRPIFSFQMLFLVAVWSDPFCCMITRCWDKVNTQARTPGIFTELCIAVSSRSMRTGQEGGEEKGIIHFCQDDECLYDFFFDSTVSVNTFELRPRERAAEALKDVQGHGGSKRTWRLQSKARFVKAERKHLL